MPIFLTPVLELLELAGNETRRQGAQRLITPELLDMAVYNSVLLSELFQFITTSQVAQLIVVFLVVIIILISSY